MARGDDIEAAVRALRAGELIGLPTETVYGLGANASDAAAVQKVFVVKGRPSTHPLIVHIADVAHLGAWATDVPPAARDLARQFWPGPLTLVLPRASHVLSEVTGGQSTIALRVPAHPVALELLQAFGGGIAAPSANRYGRISPTTAQAVREELGDAVAVVLDGGACDVGLESTIVACLDGQVSVLRPGRITREDVARVSGPLANLSASGPRVPGSSRSHYAPRTPLELVRPETLHDRLRSLVATGTRVAVLACQSAPAGTEARWISAAADAHGYGHDLYGHLRELDRADADRLLVERPPLGEAWAAVHDRLERAAAARSDDDVPAGMPEASAP